MAQTIKLKRSATTGNTPTTSQLDLGELGINTTDGKLFLKKSVSGTESIVDVGGLPLTGGTLTGNLSLSDNVKAQFGAGNDLQIFHQSSNGNSIIKETGGGILSLQTNGSRIGLWDSANAQHLAEFITGGAVRIWYDGDQKFSTTSTGIDVTGNVETDSVTIGVGSVATTEKLRVNGTVLTLGGSVSTPAIGIGDVNTGVYAPTAGTLGWTVNGTQRLLLNSTGIDVIGSVVADGLTVDGSTQFNTGAAGVAEFYHSSGLGGLRVTGAATGSASTIFLSNDKNGTPFDIYSFWGNGSDDSLEFFSGGSPTTGTKRLKLANNGDISFYNDSAAQGLFWDSSTSSLGIGTTAVSSFAINDLVVGSGSTANGMTIYSASTSEGIIRFADGTSGIQQYAGQVKYNHTNDSLNFYTNGSGTSRLALDSSGNATFTGDVVSQSSLQIFKQSAGAASVLLQRSGATNPWYLAQGNTATNYFEIMEGSTPRLTIANGGNALFSGSVTADSLTVDTSTVSASPSARFRRNHGGQAYQQLSGLSFYWNTSNGLQDNTIVYGASANSSLKFTQATGSAFNDTLTINSSGNAEFSGSVTSTGLTVNGSTNINSALTIKNNYNETKFVRNVDVASVGAAGQYLSIGALRNGSVVTPNVINGVTRSDGTSSSFALMQDGANSLSFNSSKNATFSGSVTSTGLTVNATGSAIELSQSATGSATYYTMDNTVETGGKRWRFGYSGGSSDKGSFSFYNQTDNNLALLLASSGATFSGSVTSTGLTVDGGTASPIINLSRSGTYSGITFSQTVTNVTGAGADLSTYSLNANTGYVWQTTDSGGTFAKALLIAPNRDISFYEDTGTTAKFFWDASAESLTIPNYVIHDGNTATKFGFGSANTMNFISNGSDRLTIANSYAVFNDAGTDYDFRVESNGNANMLFVDGGNNRVGVGTASPSRQFTVENTLANSGGVVGLTSSDSSTSGTFGIIHFGNSTDSSLASINGIADGATDSGALIFKTEATGGSIEERTRIASNGTLYHGKTADSLNTGGLQTLISGQTSITQSYNEPLRLNRMSSEGAIQKFYYNGAEVGSIGTFASRLYIGNGDTFLTFEGAADKVYPATSTGAGRDNQIDLGGSSSRFKDLYLSNNATAQKLTLTKAPVGTFTLEVDGTNTGQPNLIVKKSTSEALRIDNNNNLLVGQSTANSNTVGTSLRSDGRNFYCADGNYSGHFNRKSSDGAIVHFAKDDTVVGSIGTLSGRMAIGSTTATHFDVGGTERMRLSGSTLDVGRGTVADATVLIDSGAGGDPTLEFDTGATNRSAVIRFKDQGTISGFINYHHQYDRMDFGSGSSTGIGMSLTDGGNLLVGKTSLGIGVTGTEVRANGQLLVTADADNPADFNRKTSDGVIALFRKDGTTVGSIGTAGGDLTVNAQSLGVLQVGGASTYGWTGSFIYPTNDNTRDLGTSGFRFKDLYLSGKIYGSTLGIGDAGIQADQYSNAVKPFRPDITSGTSDNYLDLGTSSVRWVDIYATNGTIQTSDRNEKQDIESLSEAEERVAVAAKSLLKKFRWKSAVEDKGDDARIHFGIIAQDLQDAFEAEGLDAGRYGMFISTTWTDEDGEEQTRMGVRYSELLAFIISAI